MFQWKVRGSEAGVREVLLDCAGSLWGAGRGCFSFLLGDSHDL